MPPKRFDIVVDAGSHYYLVGKSYTEYSKRVILIDYRGSILGVPEGDFQGQYKGYFEPKKPVTFYKKVFGFIFKDEKKDFKRLLWNWRRVSEHAV